MVRAFRIAWCLCVVWAANSAAMGGWQSDRLTPIRPSEEQGKRRDVMIGFRSEPASPQELAPPQESEDLPPPRQAGDGIRPDQEPEEIAPSERSSPSGEFGEEVRQRYPDGSTQILRHVRQDAEGNFVNHGAWKLFNRRGQVLAEGEFVDGRMHGTWSRWHPDGDPAIQALWQNAARSGPYQSIATFVDGHLEGSWIVYDRLRKKIFEMQYADGTRHGPAMWWDPAGRLVREVRFNRGILDGRLIEYDENQRPLRETVYRDGCRVYSQPTWYSAGKKKTEDFYLDGKLELDGEDDWWEAKPAEYVQEGSPVRHGASEAWYENGQLRMSGQFEQGKRHGTFTWWHANGQRQLLGVYNHGQRTEAWTWWHENGMKSVQGAYQLDEPVGEWVYWDLDGKVVRRSTLGRTASGLDSMLENSSDDPEQPAESKREPSPDELPWPADGGVEELPPPSDGDGN